MSERRPTLCIVAGPNGSGKTSTTVQLLANEWTEESLYYRKGWFLYSLAVLVSEGTLSIKEVESLGDEIALAVKQYLN